MKNGKNVPGTKFPRKAGNEMGKPTVAIIGKPNVGKSTFFNYIVGERKSIVEDTPGVTRDRVYADTEWRGRKFTLIDTGGIEPKSTDEILVQMKRQAQIAMETADVIIFLTDIKQGVTAADHEVATMLRKTGKPIVLVCNKADRIGDAPAELYEFYNLGLGEPYPVSALNQLGTGEVLDAVYNSFPEETSIDDDDEYIRVAVIGKPNAGKSSLLNVLVGEDKAIVTSVAGTTRDVLEESIKLHGIGLNIIDTAGIRQTKDVVEKIGVEKSLSLIDKADLVLFLLNNNEDISIYLKLYLLLQK